MEPNILLMTDSYKMSHWKQYPPKTESVYSYYEARGGYYNRVMFFGLQAIIKKYLTGQVVTKEKILYAKERIELHLGKGAFNYEGWDYILQKHDGHLPIRIMAVPEGTKVTIRNVMMTIENTDPHCFWLTNYLETLLSQVWYPCTVATQSHEMKNVIKDYLKITGCSLDGVEFKLHDFGFRGVSSVETAGMGGCAHLVNFLGTDTFEGIEYAKEYYGEDMAGFSIPASEHSTITSWGRHNEAEAMANMLRQYPTGLVACVSDSYNIYDACKHIWGSTLRDKVLSRDGCLVIRPDSGDPMRVIPKILHILFEKFGGTVTSTGHKLLNSKVRIIQGDGIDSKTLCDILDTMAINGWAADNIAFGSGGGLLQKLNRDTCEFAIKCSAVKVNGVWKDVYKEPVDSKMKTSKKGRLSLIKCKLGNYKTVSTNYPYQGIDNLLKIVFLNGVLTYDQKFSGIRERANE